VNVADLLVQIVELDIVLWTDGDRLRFRAPEGALDGQTRASAARCRGALRALVDAGAVLPIDRGSWPDDAVDAFEERAAIMEFDGGLTRAHAEREAERLVRLDHTRAFVAQLALASVPDAAAVASRP
jgi:hypothetical protein